jgi:23S rRNA pseudouridine2605 synthase
MSKPPPPTPAPAQGRRAPRRAPRPAAPEPTGPQRLPKLLARAGVASRRDVERMIADGRVALRGEVLSLPAPLVTTLDGVTVDGLAVARAEAARLFRLHKPAGVLTTNFDARGRQTVYDLVPKDFPRLLAVGRLDMTSEGLILMTNDGGLKRMLELPATGLERHYRVRAYGAATQQLLDQVAEGVEIEGVRYGPVRAFLESKRGDNAWIEVMITEGKNREVRRVMEWLGLKVNRLIRVGYGPFVLGDLPVARLDEVAPDVIAHLQRELAGRAPRPRLPVPEAVPHA